MYTSTCSRRGAWIPALVAAVALASAKPAAAQPATTDSEPAPASATPTPTEPQANESAAALSLFEEARRLVKAGDYAGACPKFEAAARIHPSPGVLLNLGDCYERTHRTARAWAEFDEAATTAARAGRQREQAEAIRRKGSLEPRLCRLLIHVEGAGAQLSIQRDGESVDRAVWGAAIPVDPGEHRVVAAEPDRVTWEATVTTGEEGRVVVVDVPELRPVPRSVAETPSPHPLETAIGFRWTPSRAAGAASMGAGAVALALAGGLLVAAKAEDNNSYQEAEPSRSADASHAVNEARVATGFVVGGAALAITGLVLWLANPGPRRAGTPATSPRLSLRTE
jgi:hypothetical protein